MRLEKIVLSGFKSFADKTELSFDYPITAIVGPNGCGKSNVVDAVKWVLGEQSVKSLRSGQMADVIFRGSSSRKSVGAAEVSLFISNTRGQLPIEGDEVQITRRIYKSGESEYRMNSKVCRLKDIRELFMDTGVGVKAYSIIEQGQVEQLLTSSRKDRRVIFEEAAGISKYKAHKKEALRKLEHTEQNLLRLADIVGEVQRQLRSVKLQAGKARNYLQYRQRLKDLQVNYSLAEYQKIKTQESEKTGFLGRFEEQFGGVAAEVAKNDALISELGRQIIETENQLNRTDNSLVAAESKIEQQLQRIEFLRTRISELQERKLSAQRRVEKLAEQESFFHEDLRQYKDEIERCEKDAEEKARTIEELEKTIGEINRECTLLEAELEDEKSGIIDIVRRTAQLHNEVQSISVYRGNLSSQKERLSGRASAAQAELETLLTEKAQHQRRMEDIEKVLAELQESLEGKRGESAELENRARTEGQHLAESKETRSALSSELAVLTDMERRREGLNNAVKDILQKRSAGKFDYIEGIVADIVVAEVEYANAIEAALEGMSDSLVAIDSGRLLADKSGLEKSEGRVKFICMDKTGPFSDRTDFSGYEGVRGRGVEFVKYDNKYAPLVWRLLGKTIVVDSLDTAAELSERASGEYRFVTLAGQCVSSDGVIKLGPLGKTTGLISRKSRLRQLEETIENIKGEIGSLQEQIEKNSQQREHLAKLCKELRTAINEANTEKMEVSSKLTVTEQSIKRLSEEQPLIAGEIELLEEQIAQSVKKEYESKQKLEELEAINNERTARIEELESKLSEKRGQQESSANSLTELKISLGQIREQSKALNQAVVSVSNQMEQNRAAAGAAEAEIANCQEQSRQAQRDILSCESAVSELFVEKEAQQDNSKELHNKVEKLLEDQKATEQLIRSKRAEQSEIEQRINQLKIELSQLEVKGQDLVERVQDELQINLPQSYESYRNEEIDWEKVRGEIVELREKIERLGNVNVDAIDSQEELEKRYEFLSSQVEDLNKSRNQLQQLIGQLNKKSREKFRETFEEVRGNFQQIFRKLFGGGKADIMLEDDEDILEAGIEIIARPPGKESMSISLLSGGEKTMTAIALLFAIFKTKPSPFCLLDEVDAALDEANNERFNLLIREFQKQSQFIVITHAKRTMSIADVLYGITMQTRGVSKKISVKFDHIEEQLATEEQAAAVA